MALQRDLQVPRDTHHNEHKMSTRVTPHTAHTTRNTHTTVVERRTWRGRISSGPKTRASVAEFIRFSFGSHK
jgi:hypothetical protein